MNALMRIDITVRNRTAASFAQVQSSISQINRSMSGASQTSLGFTNRLGAMTRGLEKYGKNLQWTGRQLEYSFTLPLVLAAGAATKFALENERAGTRLQKVYGDMRPTMQAIYQQELPALRRAFEELSNVFGVNQSEVIDVAAAWAAAGSSGVALAKQTRLTMEAMILGDMKAVGRHRRAHRHPGPVRAEHRPASHDSGHPEHRRERDERSVLRSGYRLPESCRFGQNRRRRRRTPGRSDRRSRSCRWFCCEGRQRSADHHQQAHGAHQGRRRHHGAARPEHS
jgi:hypothetical protein